MPVSRSVRPWSQTWNAPSKISHVPTQLGLKQQEVSLLKAAKLFKQIAVAAERPILSELEMLLGPSFRSFCEHAQRRNTVKSSKFAPLLREQASHAVTDIGPKQNSATWYAVIEPVAKRVVSLVDDEAQKNEIAAKPALALASSIFKLDLTKVGREMTFSC